ncbi:MAG TPA: crosslink repair DNA glycosylase YcaQ family protein [Solirubrobacteraceae bacterium]|nr:crosslink repair DNA glycosylase YcaQ family protein [Solirubrobacteraceae bacterium]
MVERGARAATAQLATGRLSALAARRIALRAQGFGRPRSGEGGPEPTAGRIAALVRRLGLLQLDSVNVFLRAHYMPVFSRLGAYDMAVLDRLAGHTRGRLNRRLVEYWAHEASLVPLETHPLLRWRMEDLDGAWGSMQRIFRENPTLVADTLELVREQGPVRAGDTGFARGKPRPGHMWNWHEGKVALEYLFYSGQVAAARRINFERHYDLSERVLPAEVLGAPTPSRADAQRQLVRISAAALGVATEPDLGDYFRLPRADSRARVAELVDTGELVPVSVRGWKAPAYLWHEAPRPRPVRGRALLSPFDPLVWFRPRAERLFGFHYRIEIYVPAAQRAYGYYVLPFLLDEALVARVDLKSDRRAGVLRVQGAFAEADVDIERVSAELAGELSSVAAWLALPGGVEVAGRGDLAPALGAALGA